MENMKAWNFRALTLGTEDAVSGARVARAVVARLALAVGVVVDLHAGRVRVESTTRLPVEALLAQLLSCGYKQNYGSGKKIAQQKSRKKQKCYRETIVQFD